MRGGRFTMITEVLVKFRASGFEDLERANPQLEITFDYTPGRPAFTPRGEYGPIDPPDPPEVSFVMAELIDGDGLAPTIQQIQEWASNWLDEDGFEQACDYAESHGGPDPDALYEAMRDDRDGEL